MVMISKDKDMSAKFLAIKNRVNNNNDLYDSVETNADFNGISGYKLHIAKPKLKANSPFVKSLTTKCIDCQEYNFTLNNCSNRAANVADGLFDKSQTITPQFSCKAFVDKAYEQHMKDSANVAFHNNLILKKRGLE